MSFLNWTQIIPRYHGEFLYEDDMDKYCEFWRWLKSPSADDRGAVEGEGDEFLVLDEYDDDIVRAHHECRQRDGSEREIRDLHAALERNSHLDDKLYPVMFKRLAPYPRWSAWPHNKQRFVVNMMRRWSVTGLPASPSEAERKLVEEFRSVTADMRAEQTEFIKFTDGVNHRSASLYNQLDPDSARYADRYLRSCQRRVGWYPRYYTELKQIFLLLPSSREGLALLPVGEPLDLGTIPFCTIPTMTKPVCFSRAVRKLSFRFPTDAVYPRCEEGRRIPLDGRYLYKQPVSRDPNVLRLCRVLPVDFVTTPSVLKQLLARTPLHGDSWHVPVTVRTVDAVDGASRRVVFLDKPLPSSRRAAPEVKQLVLNRAVRSLLCRQHGDGVADYSVWTDEQVARHEQSKKRKFVRDGNVSACGESGEEAASGAIDDTVAEDASDSDDSSCSDTDKLTIEDDEEDEQQEETEEVDASFIDADSLTDHSIPSPDQPAEQASDPAQTSDDPKLTIELSEDPDFLQPDPSTSVNYRVWKLGGYHILVRTNTHGMRESAVGDRRLIRYTLHARCCHLACFGVPVMSGAELLCQWLDCLLRPGSRVLRLHVEPRSCRLVCAEQRSLHQLRDEFGRYATGFDPERGLAALAGVLEALAPLAPGSYLLAGGRESGMFARLMCDERHGEAVGKTEWLDLRSLHGFGGGLSLHMLSHAPALPIDTSVLTPYNIRFGFVPGLFQCKTNRKLQDAMNALTKRKRTAGKSPEHSADKTSPAPKKKKKKKKPKKKDG